MRSSDVIVGAALVSGRRAPVLLDRSTVGRMTPGSAIVDVAIDQGGSFETSRPTTHANPTYVDEGVNHYCVTNIPGAVPVTATKSLTNATLPWIQQLADQGLDGALQAEPALGRGLNIRNGEIVHPEVAASLGES